METNKNTAPVATEKDRNAVSLDLMNRMKLHGMARAFRESLDSTMAEAMTPDAFLPMLLAREWDCRSDAAIQRLIRQIGFRYTAFLEKVDYPINRGLDRNQMERLASLEFVTKGQDLFITGPSGTGKSHLATALGYQACKEGIRTCYASAPKLMGALKVAKTKGTLESELKKIERCPLLILDDLFLVPMDAKERPLLLDIIEDRHERKSIVVTSQLNVSDWYDAIGEPTVADAILDRIVHSAHHIELKGESVRKMKAYGKYQSRIKMTPSARTSKVSTQKWTKGSIMTWRTGSVRSGFSTQAQEIAGLFGLLYHFEHKHRIGKDGWTAEDHLQWRQRYSRIMPEKIHMRLMDVKDRTGVPPDDPLLAAAEHALKQWYEIPRIFESPAYRLDNNEVERVNRYISLTRRRLTIGSHTGAEAAALYNSLAITCNRCGVNVYDYFCDIIDRCAAWPPNIPLEKYRELLLDRWKPSQK